MPLKFRAVAEPQPAHGFWGLPGVLLPQHWITGEAWHDTFNGSSQGPKGHAGGKPAEWRMAELPRRTECPPLRSLLSLCLALSISLAPAPSLPIPFSPPGKAQRARQDLLNAPERVLVELYLCPQPLIPCLARIGARNCLEDLCQPLIGRPGILEAHRAGHTSRHQAAIANRTKRRMSCCFNRSAAQPRRKTGSKWMVVLARERGREKVTPSTRQSTRQVLSHTSTATQGSAPEASTACTCHLPG